MKISIIVPVLNAEPFLQSLFESFATQRSQVVEEVILVDSGSKDNTALVAGGNNIARLLKIDQFSHGRARNLGVQEARGEVIVFISQDAVPMGDNWLSRLVEPLKNPAVAAVYSRQVPKDDASPMERFFLSKRFPDGEAVVRSSRPGEKLTLEKVFFSNVSSAVRRSIMIEYPFDEELIMSEDQQLSCDVMAAGYSIVYQPASVVMHSHNYTLLSVFKRYFDSVYSLSNIFPNHGVATSIAMGARYVAGEVGFILRKYPLWFPYYIAYTFAKSTATLLAHCGDYLPNWIVKKVSLHDYYWT